MADEFQDKVKSGARSAFDALREPEGMATAALGAFLINPLVGLALGVGQGILARRDRKSALDIAAFENGMLRDLDAMHQEAVAAVQGQAATETDKLQLDAITKQFEYTRKMAMHPDPAVRARAFESMEENSTRIGAWLEDLEGRQETLLDKNVSILDEQSVVARSNFQASLEIAQTVQQKASEFHQLLSDDSFDVNSPAGRARMAQLLDQTPRELLADPADMSDALQAVGANAPGILGAILAYKSGKMKAEEFTFTKEEFRQIAHAMLKAADTKAKRGISDAQTIGQMLDKTAQGIGYQPALSYLDRIITGKVQEGADVAAAPGAYGPGGGGAAPTAPGESESEQPKFFGDFRQSVESVKEKATGVIGSMLDPTGYWRSLMNKDDKPARRPTN
jgi:hypothetical protein